MPEEQLNTDQVTTEMPIIEKEAPESDVQVDIEKEDGGEASVPAAPAEEKPAEVATIAAEHPSPKKVRKGNTADERIAKLTKENADISNYAMSKEREAQDFAQKLRIAEEHNKFLTQANVTGYEKEATDKQERALVDLKRANAEGDIDAMVDAQKRLAESTTLLAQVSAHKVQNPPVNRVQNEVQAPQNQPAKRNPVADAWIDRNDWLKKESDNFDSEMANDALQYAENLAKELIQAGRGAEVGTQRYFKTIDKYIEDTYEDEEEVTNAPPPVKKAGSPVAAQTRGPAAPLKPEQQRITLSPAEQQVAMMMGLRDQNGNVLSKEEHFKAYARSKAADGKHAARDAALAQRR